MNLTVTENISKKIIVANWAENLEIVYHRMKKANAHKAVVVDDNDYLTGMISDQDFQKALFVGSDFLALETAEIGFNPHALVRDYMCSPVEIVESNAQLKVVVGKMVEENIPAILVTESNRLLGLVTKDDLLQFLVHRLDEVGYQGSTTVGKIIKEINEANI